MGTKWYRRGGAIAGGIVAGLLAVGTAFAVVNATDTSSQTGELSPLATAEPLDDDASDTPVLRMPEPSASPETDEASIAGPTSSPDDDDDDASPDPSASPDDDDDGDNSGPRSANSGPGNADDDDDDDDDDDNSGRGGGDDDNSGRGSGDDD